MGVLLGVGGEDAPLCQGRKAGPVFDILLEQGKVREARWSAMGVLRLSTGFSSASRRGNTDVEDGKLSLDTVAAHCQRTEIAVAFDLIVLIGLNLTAYGHAQNRKG